MGPDSRCGSLSPEQTPRATQPGPCGAPLSEVQCKPNLQPVGAGQRVARPKPAARDLSTGWRCGQRLAGRDWSAQGRQLEVRAPIRFEPLTAAVA